MIKIGVTGGIASGKTLLSDTLASLGAKIIDADIISREVVTKGSPGAKLIKDNFGAQFFDADGELRRRALGDYVFGDSTKITLLNDLLHPLIKDKIIHDMAELRGKVDAVFVIVPLLIESGMEKMFEQIWVVKSDQSIRIKRLMERDNINAQQAENILKRQLKDKDRLKYADVVLSNNGDKESFVDQIMRQYAFVKADLKGKDKD